ncbi:hypothetical protein KC19_7G019300 [Ceratodon purpureus]|uniref:SMP-30/Gluconolactonase/LRE-like region domain-containing protein n=1 Tax=Ceratodon purpureus TaxID=3225 RepID=A0A8T0H6F5_CERPU|nr:hypothetical protein KC19_7G019300 [Ceratodon purpureus]
MQCNDLRKQGNGVSSGNGLSPSRVKLPESFMQRKDLDESSEKGSVIQKRACKFCGRRSCKIGLSKESAERARSPEMQPPSCQAPSTENVLGGLRQLTLQQQAQVEKSAASNIVRSCKPGHGASTPGSDRVLEPELEYSEIESTDDTGSKYQRRKRALSATALKLWAKLSPPPLLLTTSIAILAVLISYLHPARNMQELPPGTCYWHQGSLINNNASPNCHFEVRDAKFLEILGRSPRLESVVHTDVQGGGVYFPDFNELYYSTPVTKRGLILQGQNSQVRKVSLTTRKVTTVLPATDIASGMALDLEGNLLICEHGQGEKGGYIQRLDLKRLNTTIVADNWFGVPFNSPNDVVVKRDGSVWFTDTTYGWLKGHRSKPLVQNQIYRIAPGSGIVDAVADGFTLPNGLAFSEDEKLLYVTDGGSKYGNGKRDEIKPHHIYVFPVYSDGSLGTRRLFAAVGVYDRKTQALGVPNGIKVDTHGNVYIGSTDGVQVFDHKGRALGLIRISGVTNLGFGGDFLNKLFILNGTGIYCIELKVQEQ